MAGPWRGSEKSNGNQYPHETRRLNAPPPPHERCRVDAPNPPNPPDRCPFFGETTVCSCQKYQARSKKLRNSPKIQRPSLARRTNRPAKCEHVSVRVARFEPKAAIEDRRSCRCSPPRGTNGCPSPMAQWLCLDRWLLKARKTQFRLKISIIPEVARQPNDYND